MTESSEGEVIDMPLSLSSKKRRSDRKSQILSDSDSEQRKTRPSKQQLEDSMKETNEDEDSTCGVEISNCESQYELHLQTPRTSERLRRKRSRSFSLPSREKMLESISLDAKLSGSQRKIKALKPRKLVNNFLRERTSYVSRGDYSSDDSRMSDFINDDDDDDDDDSAESSVESDCGENINKDSGISLVSSKNRKAKKRVEGSVAENYSDGDNDDDSDIPSSIWKKKSASRRKLTPTIAATTNSDSDESFTNRSKGSKRRKVIQCSDSDENNMLCQEKGAIVDSDSSDGSESSHITKNLKLNKGSAPLRPRSKRVQNLTQQQKDKHNKMFGTFLKKRQTAKLEPKERLAKNRLGGEETSSASSSSESERDAFQEAVEVFMPSSEMEEEEDDRNFIDDAKQSSDDGLNSDVASEFLKLLDTFTGKPKNKEIGDSLVRVKGTGNIGFKRPHRRRKKIAKKVSQWRRIKMEADSEESDNANGDVGQRYPPLHVAVLENDFELVDKLIKEDNDCVYELDYRKRTALHLAALEDRVDLVKLLLDCGADRTALDCYHLPAIAYAAGGQPECMKLLLHHANIKSISKSMRDNFQGMNLLHFAIHGENRDALEFVNRARCLELLFSQDKMVCSKLLEEKDSRGFAPLVAAVYAGQHKCVKVLLKMGANAFTFKTDDGGNLLHFAVECSSHFKVAWECDKDTSLCMRELLKAMKGVVNDPDDHGFTPLMYACESGNAECIKALLESRASVNCSDSHGTSSLHLAAMSGDNECVQLLLKFGHKVDCVDRYGWPPLLYANFKAHESCVLALMKPKPEQVFILGDLLKRARNELEKKRAVKVVKNVLVSLANHDAYYTVFNDFIRRNPEMLEENNYGLLQHTWRAILDFDNKRRWFLRKLSQIKFRSCSLSLDTVHLDVDRENVLGSAMNAIGKTLGHALRSKSLSVTFKDEPGICTGPKREFFACFCKDVIDPKRGLFTVGDDSQYSPVPNAYFAKYVNNKDPADSKVNTALNQSGVTVAVKREQTSDELAGAMMSAVTPADQSSDSADEQLVSSVMSTELTNAELMTVTHPEELSNSTVENQQSTPAAGSHNGTVCRIHQESENDGTSQSDTSNSSSGGESMEEDQDVSVTCSSGDRDNTSQTSHATTWISCTESSSDNQSIVNLSLRSKLKQLRFIGRLIGFAVCQGLLLNLQLSKPFVKQILGIPLSHPDDLGSFDYELHKNAVVWVRENCVNDLDLPFSVDALNPWNSKPVTIELSGNVDKKLTDDNKEEYVKLVSQLKLETLVKDEVAEFAGGLNEVIPRELLSLFTADEFSLLIGGVAKIDVDDWEANTKYQGCLSTTQEIAWFWDVVSQLKEEEKALLMKFSTGSPCVPIGGFAALTGLGGATKFTILKIDGVNKIPMASTCFNMLKLTSYSSEKHLKDKLLIAIRHGAEGFSFS